MSLSLGGLETAGGAWGSPNCRYHCPTYGNQNSHGIAWISMERGSRKSGKYLPWLAKFWTQHSTGIAPCRTAKLRERGELENMEELVSYGAGGRT